MGRRTLLLVAALLLAAVGTGVLFVFLRATTSSLASSGAGSRTTTVVVPKQEIPEGTPITKALFTNVNVDASLATTAQYVTPAGFDKVVDKTIATRRLAPLTPVRADAFGQSVTATSAIPLTPNTMSIAVEVDDPARVGTFLYPGARTTLWLLRQGNAGRNTAKIVLPEVTVVTIGSQPTIPQPTDTGRVGTTSRAANSIVVLRVTQDEAARVLLAQEAGSLYFTLLGANTTPTAQTYDESILSTP